MATAPAIHAGMLTESRKEARADTVRIVEYSEFPRRDSDRGLRVGYTRNVSGSGVCLGVDHPESVGSLLRLGIRGFDGCRTDARIGRVAWTSVRDDGRHWMGIELLTDVANAAAAPNARLRFDGVLAPSRPS